MHLYLDDSGSIDRATGNFYVWAGFSIKSGQKKLSEVLKPIFDEIKIEQENSVKNSNGEAKGNIATFKQRVKVFNELAKWEDLRICYVIIDKSLVNEGQIKFHKDWSARQKEQLENYFISKVVTRLVDPLYADQSQKKFVLTIDGQPKRQKASTERLHEYLSLRINFPKWKNNNYFNNLIISYNQEKNIPLLQAADFIASFINEYYRDREYSNPRNPKKLVEHYKIWDILDKKIHHRVTELKNHSQL